MAAKHHITVAEIHESNAADLEKVISKLQINNIITNNYCMWTVRYNYFESVATQLLKLLEIGLKDFVFSSGNIPL